MADRTNERHLAGTTLFVLAAHVPTPLNCFYLQQTVTSIQRYHPQDPILVVDNESPHDNVRAALSRSTPGLVTIVREDSSHGQLGSWAAAWRWLTAASRSNEFERMVLLQHSTRLTAPLPMPLAGCDATSLNGLIPVTGKLRYNRDMVLAAAVAAALDIPCAPPCATSCAPCSPRWQPRASNDSLPTGSASRNSCVCLAWQSNVDSTLMLTRQGWDALVRYRMWPQGSQPAVAELEPFWSWEALPAWLAVFRSPPEAQKVALERLSGILLAAINSNSSSLRTTAHDPLPSALPRCKMQGYLHKTHGRTTANNSSAGNTSSHQSCAAGFMPRR